MKLSFKMLPGWLAENPDAIQTGSLALALASVAPSIVGRLSYFDVRLSLSFEIQGNLWLAEAQN